MVCWILLLIMLVVSFGILIGLTYESKKGERYGNFR